MLKCEPAKSNPCLSFLSQIYSVYIYLTLFVLGHLKDMVRNHKPLKKDWKVVCEFEQSLSGNICNGYILELVFTIPYDLYAMQDEIEILRFFGHY